MDTPSSLRLTFLSALFEQYLRHHAFVLMAEQMTVEHRHISNNRIEKIHNQINRSSHWHIHSVTPVHLALALLVLCIDEEMRLVDVKGMHFRISTATTWFDNAVALGRKHLEISSDTPFVTLHRPCSDFSAEPTATSCVFSTVSVQQ